MIQKRRVTERLNFYLQVRARIRRAEYTGIEINHVNLVRRAEEALRQRIALRIRTGAESRAMSAKRRAFTGVADIAGHSPTVNSAYRIERSSLEVTVIQR